MTTNTESCSNVRPWERPDDWAQVEFSIQQAMVAMGPFLPKLRAFTRQVAKGYTDIEGALDRVCLNSCTSCTDLCCSRATVWYDLKDLLFIYLNSGEFPPGQINREPDGSCCNLTPSGCRIIRSNRPFVCSWYICPTQKQIIRERKTDNALGIDILATIKEIQLALKELEAEFISATCRPTVL